MALSPPYAILSHTHALIHWPIKRQLEAYFVFREAMKIQKNETATNRIQKPYTNRHTNLFRKEDNIEY